LRKSICPNSLQTYCAIRNEESLTNQGFKILRPFLRSTVRVSHNTNDKSLEQKKKPKKVAMNTSIIGANRRISRSQGWGKQWLSKATFVPLRTQGFEIICKKKNYTSTAGSILTA
jgi:hypothetical protein